MPFGDGTGPMGYGPMTGRAAGYCTGYPAPGYMNPRGGYCGWGRGFGGGRGRGWRNMYHATGLPGWARGGWAWPVALPAGAPGFDTSREAEFLEKQASFLEHELAEVKKRLAQLAGEGKEEDK
ncbi:MAG: DUF5320 domain-containing protein [Clostridia bacterium]|nr:DUF5320 domain-containing protein [Clostridia bacterium]